MYRRTWVSRRDLQCTDARGLVDGACDHTAGQCQCQCPLVRTTLYVLPTFPIFYAICMRNHCIIIGNVVAVHGACDQDGDPALHHPALHDPALHDQHYKALQDQALQDQHYKAIASDHWHHWQHQNARVGPAMATSELALLSLLSPRFWQ